MEPHVEWGALPAGVRQAVQTRIGEVISAETVAEGITCRTALILTTSKRHFFVKGVPTDDLPPLLHTDTNPHHLLITEQRGYLVDWAMPPLGPSWVDPAQTAVRLLENGCTPAQARAWLSGFPDWERTPRDARERFIEVVCRDWTAKAGEKGAEPSNARFRSLLPPAAVL